jgi:UDP-N-acetylglucosamine transferase subunit ALG13
MKKNKALFAVSSLWFGHATRTLVIIKYYLNLWYQIDIISFWNALNYLKSELRNKVGFIELKDYPPLERWKWLNFYYYLIIDIIKTNYLIKKENNYIKKIEHNYDFIFSDWKYGIYSKKIPSFLLTHQLSFIMPKWLKIFLKISDYFNYKSFKKFTYIFIPDYKDIDSSLAWILSHPEWVNKLDHSYIWILSSLSNLKLENENKIDYLFTITGYLMDDKDSFVDNLIKQSEKLNWKKVFILWDTRSNTKKELDNNIVLYPYVSWLKREEFYKNAEIIISRAWYTTIMDLVELEKKAILYPTPNQTEQEYLAKFLSWKKIFVFWNEKSNLIELIKKVNTSKIYETELKTKKSLIEIEKIIFKYI